MPCTPTQFRGPELTPRVNANVQLCCAQGKLAVPVSEQVSRNCCACRRCEVIRRKLFDLPQIGPLCLRRRKLLVRSPRATSGQTTLHGRVGDRAPDPRVPSLRIGKHSWDLAEKSPIRWKDVRAASTEVVAARRGDEKPLRQKSLRHK